MDEFRSRRRRVLVLATDVDVALRVSRSIAETGLEVRATTENADFIEMAHAWRPTHVAVGVGGDPRRHCVDFVPHALVDDIVPGEALPGRGRASDDAAWATLEDLDDALDRGRLRVAYQPIIDGRDGSLYAVEALARWRGPYGVPVAPEDFVTLAEMSGRIDRLTESIFSQAMTWFARHFATSDTKLCLNLSARSLVERRLPQWLGRLCGSVGVAPSRLLLEVTETSVVADAAGAEGVLVELSEGGFEVALDDFGAGSASLLQLARYPFSKLKVDRQLVAALADSSKVAAILVGILALARELDLTVVAEGIEDEATGRRLVDMGFTLMQGNAIAPPMEPRVLLSWLESRPGS